MESYTKFMFYHKKSTKEDLKIGKNIKNKYFRYYI